LPNANACLLRTRSYKDKGENDAGDQYILSKAVHDDFVQKVRGAVNDDILTKIMDRMSAVVRKRKNTLTAEEYRIPYAPHEYATAQSRSGSNPQNFYQWRT